MINSSKARCGKLLLALLALLLAGAGAAPAPSTDELLSALRKSLPQTANGNDAQIAQYVGMVKGALLQGRYAEVQQYLATMRIGPAGANEQAAALIDQLMTAVQVQAAAATAERDAALDSIVAEVSAKFVARAPAADFDVLLKRIASLPAASGQYNDPSAQKFQALQLFVMRWQDYLLQSGLGNSDQANNALNELIQISARMPVVPRSQLVALQADASKRPAIRTDAIAARFETLRKAVEAAVDSAKTAADFDAVLADLAKPVESGGGYNGNAGYQLESLRRFAHRWQDYFSQLEAGNGTAAQNALRELANDNSSETFYPRSRILARLNGKSAAAAPDVPAPEPLVTPEALNLDTLDKLVRQLAIRRISVSLGSSSSDSGIEDLASEAGRIRAAANQLALGNSQPVISLVRMQNTGARTGTYALPLIRIQQTLVLRALPGYIEAPSDLKPSDKDTPETYLKNVVARGRESKDWRLVYRALDAGSTVGQMVGVAVPLTSDLTAYRGFFTGLNQEKAGQWTAAVRSYLGALRADAPNLPAEEIGRHLDLLKSSHPQDYEMAERQPDYNYIDPSQWPTGIAMPGRYLGPGMSPAVSARMNAAAQNAAQAGTARASALPAPPEPESAPSKKPEPPAAPPPIK